MKYRVTFDAKSGKDADNRIYDVDASDMDEAFQKAYRLCESDLGADPCYVYSDTTIEEFPNGVSNIGIRFSYHENRTKKDYSNYLVIHAESERQAVDYYNATFLGKSFWQPWPHRPDEKGNCTYGRVEETYFAACPGYDADATLCRKE